ncbi:MAG: DinB family protein [Gemmatimonadetes bacterium]|nr:DinB family protein [Gemmatimonadota bacterium]
MDPHASPKHQFLDAYDREHETTMRVLHAYPADQLDLRPHEKCKTAKELAWGFAMERGLGTMVFNDEFVEKVTGEMPQPPGEWDELLDTVEKVSRDFRELVASTPDEELMRKVRFFTAPRTMGEVSRLAWIWFLLHDEIHHRGQFSVYLRMAGGKVPSIYGPTADEPWM